jgi:hypothetical protein
MSLKVWWVLATDGYYPSMDNFKIHLLLRKRQINLLLVLKKIMIGLK